MAKKASRAYRRTRIHQRIRKALSGTAERPRLCVFRSLKHMYAQIIDDQLGRSLVSASTLKVNGEKLANGSNIDAARRVGTSIAQQALASGIREVVFDRGGYRYFGRVKALADAARELGLKF